VTSTKKRRGGSAAHEITLESYDSTAEIVSLHLLPYKLGGGVSRADKAFAALAVLSFAHAGIASCGEEADGRTRRTAPRVAAEREACKGDLIILAVAQFSPAVAAADLKAVS